MILNQVFASTFHLWTLVSNLIPMRCTYFKFTKERENYSDTETKRSLKQPVLQLSNVLHTQVHRNIWTYQG